MGVGESLAAQSVRLSTRYPILQVRSRGQGGEYPARSRLRFKLQPVRSARSRQFIPNSIRKKRPPKQEKIAGHYTLTSRGPCDERKSASEERLTRTAEGSRRSPASRPAC